VTGRLAELDAELDTIFEGVKASFEQAPDASDGAAPAW
jgi:hypothetical protein